MVWYIIGIIVTFSIGAIFGITIMCCFVVGSDSDKRKKDYDRGEDVNTRKPDLKYNASSCVDNTSFEALQNVGRHERRELICKIKELARDYGYRIVSTIKLKEIESDNNG